jgi:hypothetical protein
MTPSAAVRFSAGTARPTTPKTIENPVQPAAQVELPARARDRHQRKPEHIQQRAADQHPRRTEFVRDHARERLRETVEQVLDRYREREHFAPHAEIDRHRLKVEAEVVPHAQRDRQDDPAADDDDTRRAPVFCRHVRAAPKAAF